MAVFNKRKPSYKSSRDVAANWETFRKGLNILLQDTEIGADELSEADNIVLVGKGVPTKRWGTQLYFQAGLATGSVRGLGGFNQSDGTVELLALSDAGYLTKKSGGSYAQITGYSWASGNDVYMSQLDNKMYIVDGHKPLSRYSNPTLVGFPTIAQPIIQGASNLSNATGTTVKSYRVSAVSNVGETLASTPFQLTNQPDNLGGAFGGTIRLQWTGVSAASGILQGYNIYGRVGGNERFLSFTPGTSTVFIDDGASIPKEFTFPPTADSTGGPIAKYVTRFQDRLVFGGLNGEPSKVLISGRVPNQEKFDLASGGNYIKIEPDAGDNITQVVNFRDRIIVFKESSIWQLKLGTQQIGNFFVTLPTAELITGSQGAIAPRSIVPVDNDIFYLDRRGVYSLGYQNGFSFDVLRTNEISVKIRPYFENLTTSQISMAVGAYSKGKYMLAFPGRGEMMVFDKERLAWTGPWTLDATVFEDYIDASDEQHVLLARNGSVEVDEFSSGLVDDKGVAFSTSVKTKAETFGDWSLFKNIRDIFVQFRGVSGAVSVNVRIETRKGTTITTKSFNITPSTSNSGWGADLWANALWGDSNAIPSGGDSTLAIRWLNLNKIARLIQYTVQTTGRNDNYELVGIISKAKPLSRGLTPTRWKV